MDGIDQRVIEKPGSGEKRLVRSALCGSQYLEIRQPVVFCGTCQTRRRMLYVLEAWRGGYWTCLTCGERWHTEDGRMERPFMRGWRKQSVEQAKDFWKRHGRLTLTKSLLMETIGAGEGQ